MTTRFMTTIPLPPAQIRPEHLVGCLGLVVAVDAGAEAAALFLSGCDLGLQRSGVLINPLELGEMSVKDLDDLL